MQTRKRTMTGLYWLAGLLLLIVGSGAILLLGQEPALLDRSRATVRADLWVQRYGGYFWESDRTVLTFRNTGPAVQAVRVDLVTGTETPCPDLSHSLLKATEDDVMEWRLSPDGKNLLWRYDHGGRLIRIVSDRDGKAVKTWPERPSSMLPLWLPDNRRWVETSASTFDGSYQPVIHDLDGPDQPCSPITGSFTWPLGVTPEGHILTVEWQPERRSLTWVEYPLLRDDRSAVSHSVAMPPSAGSLMEAELSPDGSRIACLIHFTPVSPLERLLGRFFPGRVSPRQKQGIWIVRRDGRGMRLLGTEDGDRISSLLWTPDGRHLSFLANNVLYITPVD